jgi:hypothetical protein
MITVREPARDIPVAGEYDIIVAGGGCTGVFAAVRAAGVACFEALSSGKPVQRIDYSSFRRKMKDGGSIVL